MGLNSASLVCISLNCIDFRCDIFFGKRKKHWRLHDGERRRKDDFFRLLLDFCIVRTDGSDVTAFSFDSVRDGYEASKTQNELLIENNDSSKLFTGALAGKIIELVFEDESIVPSEIVLDEVVIGDPLGFSIDLVEVRHCAIRDGVALEGKQCK